MTRYLNRRSFLRGLGGACVAAPFLGSIAERGVKAQSATPPKRLILMFTHYGCVTTRFFPQRSHGPLSAADLEGTTLKHLVPHVDKLLLPRGIRAMNEWTADMSLGQGNDTHLLIGSYLTCQPVSPNSNNPFDFDQSSLFRPLPVGPSLDHVIAQQLSPGGAPLQMRVGNSYSDSRGTISYSAAQTMYPGIGSTTQIFQNLTGLFDGSMSSDSYQVMRGKSVLDVVREDLNSLEALNMSRADTQKLEAWKDLLNDTGNMVASALCSSETANSLGLTQDNVKAGMSGGVGIDLLTQKITDSLDGADLYSNLAVLAAACNANPVIILKYPPNYVFTGLGLKVETHGLSHRIGDATMQGACLDGVLDMLLTIDDYYARKFAHLVATLNSINEGDGTLLDHSAAVWMQEMSDGCAHNLNNLPIVQAGSMGGYFKTGWSVNVEDGAANLTAGNSEAFCGPSSPDNQVNGVKKQTGTSPQFANAPINKYYCNLMNALGVKAGADGFPAVDGTAEVTKFGYSDLTTDFIGGQGAVASAGIHNPGEYTALKANA